MNKLIYSMVFFLSSTAFASGNILPMPKAEPWAFGVGFGTESNYDNVTLLEIKSPTLFSFFGGTNQVALVLSYETKEISQIDKDITPIHLLIELTTVRYKDLVRSYVRLGGGSVLVDDTTVFPASNFFNLQFQIGADIATGFSEVGVGSSFFVQAMLNSPGITNPPTNGLEVFDGTTMLVGLRMYF